MDSEPRTHSEPATSAKSYGEYPGEVVVLVAADAPAKITQAEWNIVQWRVWDTHRAITELEASLKPALASILGGKLNLSSMLFGKRER